MDRVLAQECVCRALAGPRCHHCKTTRSCCHRERRSQRKAPVPGTTTSHTSLAKSFGAGYSLRRERSWHLLHSFTYLLASTLSKTFCTGLHVQKNLSDSFTSVFIPIQVLCSTDTFKEPHQQSVYIEEKVLQIWTPVDCDSPQVLGDMSFYAI